MAWSQCVCSMYEKELNSGLGEVKIKIAGALRGGCDYFEMANVKSICCLRLRFKFTQKIAHEIIKNLAQC